MDPTRKRKVRLVVALTAAILLAGALVYTSFGDATAAETPSQVLADGGGSSVQMTGKVVPGTVRHEGATLLFRIRDLNGGASLPVSYQGIVPDPFQAGREVIVQGELRGGTFVAQRDSLVTKCPSKYQSVPSGKTL